MISRLFRSRVRSAAPSVPTTPEGTVVWAVGDIHGRLDLLEPLVEAMTEDLADSTAARKVVVFLGDYIDRGPESRGVLQHLAALSSNSGIEWRFLKGNHEAAMLAFLEDPSAGARWCEYGGDKALQSWGLRMPELAHRIEAWARVAADLRHRMTPAELAFLEALELSVTVGDYFFSHAGARPGVALDRQSSKDLMWIRQPFLDSTTAFERVIVHGHTPALAVHADQRRIGIDTKAYETGVLSAVRLERDDRRLLQAIGPRRARDGDLAGADPGSATAGGVAIRNVPLSPDA